MSEPVLTEEQRLALYAQPRVAYEGPPDQVTASYNSPYLHGTVFRTTRRDP